MFNSVLPTLDLVIWVSDTNKVMFSFYKKEMVSPMVLHKRSAMPEGVRRATLNQELVRRMVNTSELVSIKQRVKVVDDYAQKLMNIEYTLKETVDTIIGGLKGYERLLSLSRDKKNPRWKPLHMAGKWNARNRRMAKLRARDNWFKGSQEVEPPGRQEDGSQEESSIGLDRVQESVEVPDIPSQDKSMECRNEAGSPHADKETSRGGDGEESRMM